MGDNGIRTHRKKSMSFSKSSLAAHKVISVIYLMVSKTYLYRFMRLNIDQITVYQSLFINKANVNRGSRNGMTCIYERIYMYQIAWVRRAFAFVVYSLSLMRKDCSA